MSRRVFFDTNVLFYALAEEGSKTEIAERLFVQGGTVSAQTLNELAAALRKKQKMPWIDIGEAIEAVLVNCPNPLPLTLETHRRARRLCAQTGYTIYDGLILASAIEAGCAVLYTEDLQHGQVIDGLRIENPFRTALQQ